jgi:tetratricopeptide (TPR) repeat protein
MPVIEEQPKASKSLGKTIFVRALAVTFFLFAGMCLFVYFDSVGCSMYYSGHPDKALEPTKRALWVQELVLGHDNLEVANTRKNLARVYDALKRFDEAEPLYVAAMKTYENKDQLKSHAYAETLCFYGDHQMYMRKYDDSLGHYKAARLILADLRLQETREYAWTLQRVANALKALNRRDEAQPIDAEATKILRKV